MKITITPSGSTVQQTPFLLCDDSVGTGAITGLTFPNGAGGQCKEGFNVDMSVVTQPEELINSNWKEEIPRGNAQYSLSFTVQRTMITSDVALAFIADHPPLVPSSGTVAIYIGNSVRYLKNAVKRSVRSSDYSDISFNMSYTFAGSYVPPLSGAAGTGTGGPFTST